MPLIRLEDAGLPYECFMVYPVYISQIIMAGKASHMEKCTPARTHFSRAEHREGRFTGEFGIIPGPDMHGKNRRTIPSGDGRAPGRILRSAKEWPDQVIAEKELKTYDEAIMFLITERQRYMPSDFGVFSELEPYVATERIEIAFVLDTWTGVEYWKGNDHVRQYVDRKETRITSMISIAEPERLYGTDSERMDRMVSMIRLRSPPVPIDPVIARTAGRVRRGMNDGGIADAIVYATALRHRAKVVTRDPHLRGLPEVVFAGNR